MEQLITLYTEKGLLAAIRECNLDLLPRSVRKTVAAARENLKAVDGIIRYEKVKQGV